MRESVAQAGFTETLTFSLCSRDDISSKIRRPLDSVPAVQIANPKTLEFQVGRRRRPEFDHITWFSISTIFLRW